jgi:hypothetical protein
MLQGNLQRHQLVSCRGQYIYNAPSPSDSEDSEDE